MRALAAAALLVACGPPVKPEEAARLVEEEFARANPAGRTGLEIKGKNVWFEAPYFVDECLEQRDLAFNDDPSSRPRSGVKRISPTYEAQRWITASTPTGYCIYLGDDPAIEVLTDEITWVGDRYRVPARITMGSPTPWFECLAPSVREPVVEVLVDQDGNARIEVPPTLGQGDCPHPLPAGEDRTPRARPADPPPRPPTREEVARLLQKIDDAFWNLDFGVVRDLTMCYDLFEKNPVGACSVGEFVALGHSFHGEQRPQDGLPWLEYAMARPDAFTAIRPDRRDPTMFHVLLRHRRTGQTRSISVQWVDGRWKAVGVVGVKAEGLTHAQYLYDLHEPDRRDIFERRLAGEPIDEHGNPLEEEAAAP